MKLTLAIALLVAAGSVHAATVVVSNCALAGPETWQPGSWQALTQGFIRAQGSPSGGTQACSVVAGEFEDYADFSAWWSSDLGRSLDEILNAADLAASAWVPYTSSNPNPAALLFLQGIGVPIAAFDPYDPASVLVAAGALESLWPELIAADPTAFPPSPALVVEAWLAPTSALPVPEPGSLGLLGLALLVQISCASRRSRALAARRSGSARTSALRAAQARRPES